MMSPNSEQVEIKSAWQSLVWYNSYSWEESTQTCAWTFQVKSKLAACLWSVQNPFLLPGWHLPQYYPDWSHRKNGLLACIPGMIIPTAIWYYWCNCEPIYFQHGWHQWRMDGILGFSVLCETLYIRKIPTKHNMPHLHLFPLFTKHELNTRTVVCKPLTIPIPFVV